MGKLDGKVAVVTGGDSGIGRAICLAFTDQGADVVVASNVSDQVETVAKEVQEIGMHSISSWHAGTQQWARDDSHPCLASCLRQ